MRTANLTLAVLLFSAASANAAITGTVIDETGKPVAGATVRAWAAEGSRAYGERLQSKNPENDPLATATTNDAGAFSIDTKGALAADVRVDKPDLRSAYLNAVDGDEPLTVILRRPIDRKLRVQSADGKPVANALVVFDPHLMARTDAAGEAPMLADNVTWIIHPDYPISRGPSGFGSSATVVKLPKSITLRGRVLNAKGAGVKANLYIGGFAAGASGDDGAFTIAHAPANWPSLRAEAGNLAALATHGSAPSIDLHLGPAMVISGTLRDEAGHAIPGGRVSLRAASQDIAEGIETTVADAKGNFAFDPLPSRTYNVFAVHPAYAFDMLAVQAGTGGNRLMTGRAVAHVSGHVLDDQHKPVAAALVSYGGANARSVVAVTDGAGAFSLRVAPVQYQMMIPLMAVKRGYASGAAPPRRYKSGEVVKDVVITMATGFPLQVQVVDNKHQPVQGVLITASGTDDALGHTAACEDPLQERCRVTDAKGMVNLRMTEGSYSFTVTPGDDSLIAPRRIASQPVTAKSSPLVIQVENGVAVSGKVAYADGTLVPNVTVELSGGINQNRQEPSADGTFNLTGLASGKYKLVAYTDDGHMSTQTADVTAPASNVVLTMPHGGRIEGRVVERGSGQPVTDFTAGMAARGPMFRPPAGSRETHSEDGSFALENVPAGPTTIAISAPGYVPATRADIQVEEGRTVSGIDVQLERGAKVSGRVTAEGKPLAGVGVNVSSLTGPVPGGPSRAVTDADGQYTLDGLAPGQPTIEFRKQGYAVKRQNIDITTSKDAHLDVELDHGRQLQGRVTDKNGVAIEGAMLSAFPAMMGGFSEQAVSGADGSFVIEGLAESHYTVNVRKRGYGSATERDVALPQTSPLIITLDSGGTVTGHVIGLTPQELGMVSVYAGGTSGSYTTASTDATGAFTLRGVPDGAVTVQATIMGTDRRAKPKTISVENGAAAPVELNFEEGFTVHGRVTFNGVPASSGLISFSPQNNSTSGASGRVTAGSYEVSGLGSGDYNVTMTSTDGGYRGKYTVSGSGTFDIDVRGATLRGHVVDAATGDPVSDATVNVSGKGSTAFNNVVSDSDGRFVVPALLDGSYTVAVRRETYSPATQTVEVSNGSVPDVEVRLEGGTPVTVVVVDAVTGVALPMANVMIESDGKRMTGGLARGDDGARIWLKPGHYRATATAYPYVQSPPTDLEAPGPTVRIALSKGGSLVIVAHSAGRARLNSPSTTTVGIGGSITMTEGRPITYGPGVNVPVEGLTPGSYMLDLLDSQNAVIKRLPVTIVAGQPTTVTVE